MASPLAVAGAVAVAAAVALVASVAVPRRDRSRRPRPRIGLKLPAPTWQQLRDGTAPDPYAVAWALAVRGELLFPNDGKPRSGSGRRWRAVNELARQAFARGETTQRLQLIHDWIVNERWNEDWWQEEGAPRVAEDAAIGTQAALVHLVATLLDDLNRGAVEQLPEPPEVTEAWKAPSTGGNQILWLPWTWEPATG